jgi:hypothetical protein
MSKLRDALLGAKVKIETLDLSELGVDEPVFVKGLTSAEMDAYQTSMLKNPGTTKQSSNLSNMRAKLCVYAICDEKGNREFTEPGDVDRLAQLDGAIINKIFGVARRLSGMMGEDEQAAQEKNSDGGQSEEDSSD